MSRPLDLVFAATGAISLLLAGCQPIQPMYFGKQGDKSLYSAMATQVEYPDVELQSLDEVLQSRAPLTLDNANFDKVEEVTLDDVVRYALSNSKVIRSLGGRVDVPSELLLQNPQGAATVFGPAIQETSPGIGTGLFIGPEAALSAFDANFSTSVNWQRSDQPLNIPSDFLGGLPAAQFGRPFAQVQELASFQARLSKTAMSGGTFSLTNTTSYEGNNTNTDFRPLASEWRTNVEMEIRQPILRGAGTQYNQIAGPFSAFSNIGTFTFDGVLLARINTDIALTDFEAGVRELVADVENAYWELYFAYRNLEARKAGTDSALKLWAVINQRLREGAAGGEPEREALAREQYWAFKAEVQSAKSALFATENRLRYIMGITASDGRLLRPADTPNHAKVTFHWHEILGESLARSIELRRQKWRVKQRELELVASKNHLMPQFDAVGRYRWNGLGDDLLDTNSNGEGRFDNAVGNLLDGDFQEWELGVQLSMRLGFRSELATVRHAKLLLAREKALLREQELELSHQVADAVRSLDEQFQLLNTNFERRRAAQAQVDVFEVRIELEIGGTTTELESLLNAQRRLADAETAYYRALVDYNRAIYLLHRRKGSLLEYHDIYLAEGPWPGKAYFDAKRMARQREHSLFLNHGYTRPGPISRGPYLQHSEVPGADWQEATDGVPNTDGYETPELLPAPSDESPSRRPPDPDLAAVEDTDSERPAVSFRR